MDTIATLPNALRRAAAVHGERPALVDGDHRWRWSELEAVVARFAGELAGLGVGRGDHVVIHRAKSAASIVSVYATQWLGAVAVPVDAMAPAGFVDGVIESCHPKVIVIDDLTDARLADRYRGVARLRPDVSPSPERVDVAPAAPLDDLDGDDAAYVIYTSGSTGTPKGIIHTHASALAYATRARATYGLDEHDVCANIAPLHFDQSTFELYAAPLAGACVVVVPDVMLRFPAELVRLVAGERCTIWYSVPTIIAQAVERGGAADADLSALRWVKFGGEAVAPVSIRRAMAAMPSARFSNVYGPAEVNQCAHHHLDGPPVDGTTIPIGRAWEGTELRLRAADGSILEGPGQGTLEVLAPTAMLGYLGDPGRTVGSFADDGRWYLTGDVVDRDDAGLLRFVGRRDRQAKVRGVRVELEAVETALTSLEGVEHAAVVVMGAGPDARLIAVVEANDIDRRRAIGALRRVLPIAAIPDEILTRPELPRTGSGKIDARAVQRLLESDESPRSDRGQS